MQYIMVNILDYRDQIGKCINFAEKTLYRVFQNKECM